MMSSATVIALFVEVTSWTVRCKVVGEQIFEGNLYTASWMIMSIVLLTIGSGKFMRVCFAFNVIEEPAVFCERRGGDLKYSGRIPSGRWNKSDDSPCSDDSATGDADEVLVGVRGFVQVDPVAPGFDQV